MAARYRKIDTRVWTDERFRALAPREKFIAMYCITGPNSNRCGIYSLSIAMGAEQTGFHPKVFRIAIGNICDTLKWSYDEAPSVLYIPTWWKYNPPENKLHLKGCLKDLHDLPQTKLLKEFWLNTRYIPPHCLAEFHSGYQIAMGEGMPNQKQEQKQEQEQNPPPPAARDGAAERKKSARRAIGNLPLPPVPPTLDTPEFSDAWARWLAHRQQIKHSLKPETATAQLGQMEKWGVDRAIAAMNFTIFKGWQGLREPDPAETGNGTGGGRMAPASPADISARILARQNGNGDTHHE